ncbi:MAG: hypothetical protein HY820_33600 [Acidobacteria bacterium]|nr:hypothetical protein [Acidobacteriota bacterium]
MKESGCAFEAEVLAAVVECAWPHRCGQELVEHARQCPVCADLVLVAGAIRTDRQSDDMTIAAVPDSGRIWWKAQMRARREAIDAAGRPITAIQVITLACAMGLIGACFGATSTWFQSLLHAAGVEISSVDWVLALKKHEVLIGSMAGIAALAPILYRLLRRADKKL